MINKIKDFLKKIFKLNCNKYDNEPKFYGNGINDDNAIVKFDCNCKVYSNKELYTNVKI